MEREGERNFAALPFGFHRRVELLKEAHPALAAKAHHIADRESPARLCQCAPARAVEPLDQRGRNRRFMVAAAKTAAMQPRRDDLGVVDDERVAGPQQVRQIAYCPVFERHRCARMHDEEPRRVAGRRRPERDAILR